MARSGILKSEVQKARDAVLADGRHPSIDAVRAALGNTGSKTTIQRYLREIDEEEGASFGSGLAVSEAIQDLVGRLAARLKEEAEAQITEIQAKYDELLAQRDAEATDQCRQAETLSAQLQHAEQTLQGEKSAHEQMRQAFVDADAARQRLAQQVADQNERLADYTAHLQSLEEKHQHAREALEHYRQSVKDQRDQEQRRHEQQVQQLQMEIRALNQTVIGKQGELTQAYQDLARLNAELAATKKEVRRAEGDAEAAGKSRDKVQKRLVEFEVSHSMLAEKVAEMETRRIAGENALHEQAGQVHAQELELVRLRTLVAGQEELLAAMRGIQSSGRERVAEGQKSQD